MRERRKFMKVRSGEDVEAEETGTWRRLGRGGE